MKQWLQSLRGSYLVKQTLLLYGSQLVMTGFGALAYILMTRQMTKAEFGDREVIMKLAVFASGFFEFGILTAGARLLAIQPNKTRERELFSLMMFLSLLLLTLFALFLFVASFFVDSLFQTSQPIGATLLLFSLPLAFIVFKIYFQLLYQAQTRYSNSRSTTPQCKRCFSRSWSGFGGRATSRHFPRLQCIHVHRARLRCF